MKVDPVCKMEVDPMSAQWASEYKGEKYYFCAAGCKKAFDSDPEKYLGSGDGHDHGNAHGHGGHDHHHKKGPHSHHGRRWPWNKKKPVG
jgi:YHS domain-containing protein